MCKVSVIIPNYNHADFLQERIDSILKQTFQDFEIIILDDCSSDNSIEIIEANRNHPKIKHIVFNNSNSGSTFKQWEKGISLAKGDFIWIAESDDYCDPTFLEEITKVLTQNPNVGLAYTDSYIVNTDGTIQGLLLDHSRESLNKTKWNKSYINNGLEEIKNCLAIFNTLPNGSANVFRKEIYNNINGVDPSFKVTADWKLWTDILSKSDIAYISKPLNYYRKHASNVTETKKDLIIEESLRVMENIATICKSSGNVPREIYKRIVYWSFAKAPYEGNMSFFDNKKKILYAKQKYKSKNVLINYIITHYAHKFLYNLYQLKLYLLQK